MRRQATARWRGEGIELFLLEPADSSDTYVGWLNDPQVNQFLESRFHPQDKASIGAFIERALDDPNVVFFGIRSQELGCHVGNVKLGPIDRHHGLSEIGIIVGDRAAWGRGIASAALRRLAEISRDELSLRKLTASCYAPNVGSLRAFEKAGFHVEGRRGRHVLLEGRPEDVILLARHLEPAAPMYAERQP